MKPIYRKADTRKTLLNKYLFRIVKELTTISAIEYTLENDKDLKCDELEKAELLRQVLSLKSIALTHLRNMERLIEFDTKWRWSYICVPSRNL